MTATGLGPASFKVGEELMDQQICYCFGYSVADLEKDIEQHGRSTIMARIMAEKKAGACQCADKNPKGR